MPDLSKYKAIISDYDGTLVGPDFKVSERLKISIAKWQAAGKYFSIASSKAFQGKLKSSCLDLKLSDPIIVNGGAEIINPKTEKIIHIESIPDETAKKLIDILSKTDYFYEVQNDKEVFASSDGLKKLQPHKAYRDLADMTADKILKIRIVTTDRDHNEIKSYFETEVTPQFTDLHFIEGNTPYSTGLDFTSEKATKYLAVLRLSEILKIRPEEIIGIGDGLNDYPLLSATGYKVAMDNSPKELIEIADQTIPDYLHDGVATFINKLLS